MGAGRGEIDTGALFREVHRGCWRADAPPLALERREVVALMPLLIRTGSVGLVWPRLRHRAVELGAIGAGLEAAYQAQVEHNLLVEGRITEAARRLGAEGIEPVLIKGWSMSRRYPLGLVRTAGDIDLVVLDADYERALATLIDWAEANGEITIELHHSAPRAETERTSSMEGVVAANIDLHRGSYWDSKPAPDALERAGWVPASDGQSISVLCPEDNLRQLCIHFLWHGATRMLRLVDIAMVVETRPADFDWERCLGDDEVRRSWVVTALGLAHHLLGARIDDTPVGDEARTLPRWLLPIAREQVTEIQPPLGVALPELLADPREVGSVLRRRWPDPITATTHLPTTFSEAPRLPFQWAVYLRQLVGYAVRRLPEQAARRLRPA